MFADEEIPIWDEYTGKGLFLEASLTRVEGGSENPTGTYGGGPAGIQDYILHIVAADHDAHNHHDDDPRFASFLERRSFSNLRRHSSFLEHRCSSARPSAACSST